MKTNKMKAKTLILILFLSGINSIYAQDLTNEIEGVSIANDGDPPSRDAVLDVISSTKGMLVPRVSFATINESDGSLYKTKVNGVDGQDGLLVFVVDSGDNYGYWYFDNIAVEWKKFADMEAGAINFWTSSLLQTTDIESGLSTNHIYSTALMNGNVGIGLNQAKTQLHVYGEVKPDDFLLGFVGFHGCFKAETDEHSFGVYDYYAGVGNGNLLIHNKKIADHNMSWQQRNHSNTLSISLSSYYNGGGDFGWGDLFFNGRGYITSPDKLFLRSFVGVDDDGEPTVGSAISLYDGQIYLTGDTYTDGMGLVTSDSTLKTNIVGISGALDGIKRITGYKYNWLTDGSIAEKQYGVMAQNIEREFPELAMDISMPFTDSLGVVTTKDLMAVNYNGLVAVLIEGMKEQQATIEMLEAQVSTLQAQYLSLDARVTLIESR